MWIEALIELLVLTWVFTCALVGGWHIGSWLADVTTRAYISWKYRDKGEQ